jgi:drug/metabolite transporter (DMT)-like permease
MTASSNLRGIGSMVLATGTFVANDTCMKLAMSEQPPLEVLVARGIGALLWCLPLVLLLGYGRQIPALFDRWVMLRAACEVSAILCFIFALQHMHIADVTALVQVSPLLVLIGVALLWADPIGPLRWALIGLGIAGAVLVAQPGTSAASPYAILGFGTALGAALRDIVSRKVAREIPGLVVALATLFWVMVAAAVGSVLFENQEPVTLHFAGLMLVAGFFLMCGHFFVFMAFRFASPRIVAPFNYTFTIWAVLSGLLVFGNFPDAPALAGMALIVATGLAVIFLEQRQPRGPA